MKKVAIVGLGWLGMPLAMSLAARGWQVTGSKTTLDGVEAARMSGIESYSLRTEPELVCEADDLDALMDADALVITLPARRSGLGKHFTCRQCRNWSTARWRIGSRGLFLPVLRQSMVTFKEQ